MNSVLHYLGIGIFAISFLMLTTSSDAEAAVDMFLKIEGIEGESQDKNHKGWIEISSVQYGISASIPSSGEKTSKAAFSDVLITKVLDKASPKIAMSTANGEQYPSGEIHFCDSDSAMCFYTIKLSNVIISQYSFSSGGDLPTESVSLAYGSMHWNYKTEKDDGKDGVEAGWDVLQNRMD
jgi:type VI secretion system secreted protein Hcp